MFMVVVIQLITWTIVSALLFYRGMNNLWKVQNEFNVTAWNSSVTQSDVVMKGYTSGVVILVVASIMIVIGPTFFIVVIIEKCYRKHKFKKVRIYFR